jgi:two-component system, chemotaxis family, chemotaxis protein CheY
MKSKRVLVIDDMQAIHIIVEMLLNDMGVTQVDTAFTGKEGLNKIEKALEEDPFYDLILCDWNLGGMQGIEVLRHVRESEHQKVQELKFVLVTAEVGSKNQAKAKDLNVTMFIEKPFKHEDLKGHVEELLS